MRALILLLAASPLVAQARSETRIKVQKAHRDTVHARDTVTVHDTAWKRDTTVKYVKVETEDTVTAHSWVPIPLPFPWPWHHTRTLTLDGKRDTLVWVNTLPGRVDTLWRTVVVTVTYPPDTVSLVKWRTIVDTVSLVGKADTVVVHGDTLVIYRCPPCPCLPPVGPPPPVTSTPEPGSFLLVGSGLAALIIGKRKRA